VNPTRPILGIDPGLRKCGWAVIVAAGTPPLALGIAPTAEIRLRVAELVAKFEPSAIALGRGTHASAVAELIATAGLPIHLTDERETTLRARARYFADHPPRGWRRFIPRGMLLPPRPVDDYAAVLIAERFLEGRTLV
jgi:RNase H-fold protein (predicted Holliday junction resolvase)